MNTLKLNPAEKRAILSWHEYMREDSQHYGDGLTDFPQEELVVHKLKESKTGEISFSDDQIDILADWMENSVKGKYGNAAILMGEEKRIYEEIQRMKKDLDAKYQEEARRIEKSRSDKS